MQEGGRNRPIARHNTDAWAVCMLRSVPLRAFRKRCCCLRRPSSVAISPRGSRSELHQASREYIANSSGWKHPGLRQRRLRRRRLAIVGSEAEFRQTSVGHWSSTRRQLATGTQRRLHREVRDSDTPDSVRLLRISGARCCMQAETSLSGDAGLCTSAQLASLISARLRLPPSRMKAIAHARTSGCRLE